MFFSQVYVEEPGVKEEPQEVPDEVPETKEMLDPGFAFDNVQDSDSRGDPGGAYDALNPPQSMEDLVAQAIPGSSGLQGVNQNIYFYTQKDINNYHD